MAESEITYFFKVG